MRTLLVIQNVASQTMGLHAFACFGAIILYVLNKIQGNQPFSLFMALNIDVGKNASWHTVLLDMILSSFIGGIAVYYITAPETAAQAIMVGLGMTGVLSVIPNNK
jgi:hypothetical protein